MIIKSCYIENFGTFSSCKMDFTEGLNVIKEDNGWGKTTLLAFIKAMFYGMTYKKNAKEFYDRRKYEPWQGGRFGGNLTFKVKEKEYCVTRFFGKKDQEDEFSLTDVQTGMENHDYSEKLGEELFGIDMESFERSIYIMLGNKEPAITDNINAKLNNLIENADDIGNYEQAYNTLDKAVKQLDKKGGNGEIQLKKDRIQDLKKQLEECRGKSQNIIGLQEKLGEYSKEKKVYADKISELDEAIKVIDLINNKKRYEELTEKKKETEAKAGKMAPIFSEGIPKETDIEKYEKICDEIGILNSKEEAVRLTGEEKELLGKLQDNYDNSCITEENVNKSINDYDRAVRLKNDINSKENELSILKQNYELSGKAKNTNQGGILCLVGVIILAAGIVTTMIKQMGAGIAMTAAGAVVLLIGLFISKQSNSEKNMTSQEDIFRERDEEINSLKEEVSDLEERYVTFIRQAEPFADTENVLQSLSVIKDNIQKYKSLRERNKKSLEYSQMLTERTKDTEEFLKAFPKAEGESYKSKLRFLHDSLRDYKNILSELKNRNFELEKFMSEVNVQELENLTDIPENADIQTMQSERRRLQGKVEELGGYISRTEKEIDDLSIEADKVQYIENEIDVNSQELSALEDKFELLKKTRKYLEEAKTNLSTRYMAGMKEAFEKYLGIFKVPDNIKIDIELSAKMEKNGKDWDSRYFSRGYGDMVEICTRLALVDAMYKEEQPFIILDDPFVNLDEGKLAAVSEAVKELSKNRQIIYCLCHESRML